MTAFNRFRANRAAWGRRARIAMLATFPVALFGCGASVPPSGPSAPHAATPDDPAWVTHRPKLPPPDPDRINFDDRTRTLALYDLPGNDRWMVQLPGDAARPATSQQRIPVDADLARVLVYYARPGMKPSAAVSVQQIRDCGPAHNSLAALQ